jgi:hypothetical protein
MTFYGYRVVEQLIFYLLTKKLQKIGIAEEKLEGAIASPFIRRNYNINIAAEMTVVHKPFLLPSADWHTLRVKNIWPLDL